MSLRICLLLLAFTSCASRAPPPTARDTDAGTGAGTSVGTTGVSLTAMPCDDPAATLSYTDAGESWGLLDTTDGDDERMEGNPIALADLDGDGDDDIVIGLRSGGLWLQRSRGDGLDTALLADVSGLVTLAVGDLDGDGALDLLGGGRGPMVVLIGDGTGGFTERTEAAGLSDLDTAATLRDASLGDVDGDGDLDLFLTFDPFSSPDGEAPHQLLHNDGLGAFTDVSEQLPEDARSGLGWHTTMADLDDDADLDLFISNADQHEWGPNRLLRNDGADGWTDLTEDCGCGETFSAMGASVGDLDRDALLDLFVTQSGPSALLRNLGDGTFAEAAVALGATAVPDADHMTFGSVLFDHDNDGWLDIAATAGPLYGVESDGVQPEEQPDVLLVGGPAGFTSAAADLGFDDLAAGRGVAAGLINGDAFLDLVVTHLDAPSRLYLSRCTTAPALVVELRGRDGPRFGEGARVELETDQGTLIREVSANPGWGAAAHPRAHFGLGELSPQRLLVRWPGGAEQEIAPISAGRLWLDEP